MAGVTGVIAGAGGMRGVRGELAAYAGPSSRPAWSAAPEGAQTPEALARWLAGNNIGVQIASPGWGIEGGVENTLDVLKAVYEGAGIHMETGELVVEDGSEARLHVNASALAHPEV